MKSTIKTRVTGFFACLTMATSLASAQGQIIGSASNTQSNSSFPPIVSADEVESAANRANQIQRPPLVPVPVIKVAKTPAESGMLTPMIATTVEETESPIEQVAATQGYQTGYSIHQASTPTLPPIVQGRVSVPNNPVTNQTPPRPINVASRPVQSGSGSRPTFPQAGSASRPALPQAGSASRPALPQVGSDSRSVFSQDAPVLPVEALPHSTVPATQFPSTEGSMVVGQGSLFPTEVLPTEAGSVINQPITGGTAGCSTCATGSQPLLGDIGCNTCATGSAVGQPVFHPPASATPVVGCSSCSGSTSNCQSCGPGGCFDQNQIDKQFAACGFISRARQYAIFDFLYFNRAGGEASAFNANPGNDFDGGFGTRITLGRRQDAASGREFSYFGVYDIDAGGTTTDPLARIQPQFTTGGTFLNPGDISGFFNTTTLTEESETFFHSIEYNRVRWGWDVVKVLAGIRYIYLEDNYNAQTQALGGQTAALDVEAYNNLIGPQIGGELFYDVGYRWSLSGFAKVAWLLNTSRAELSVVNNGFESLDIGDTDTSGAFLLDLGITGHYQLSSRARFRLGYNLLFIDGVSTSEDAIPLTFSPLLDPSTGDDEVFFHGLSLGLEFYQ